MSGFDKWKENEEAVRRNDEKWISVDVLRPKDGTHVWCWWPNGEMNICSLRPDGDWYYLSSVKMKTPAMWRAIAPVDPPSTPYAFERCKEAYAKKVLGGKEAE